MGSPEGGGCGDDDGGRETAGDPDIPLAPPMAFGFLVLKPFFLFL